MKNFKVTISRITQEDSYQEGCIYNSTDHAIFSEHSAKDLTSIIEHVENTTGIRIKDFEYYEEDNILEASILEDDTGYAASEYQVNQWKRNKLKLWLGSYTLRLTLVETTDLNASELLKTTLITLNN